MGIEAIELSDEDWLVNEDGYNQGQQGMFESIFTLGNGYLGVRGCLEENPEGSYRGTYIAGIFDKSESFVNELVKAPCGVDFSVWAGDHKFSVDRDDVLSHKRVLDMRKGVLHRTTRLKDSEGRVLRLEFRRVVFSHQVHGSVTLISVTPENFSEEIRIISGLNGDVVNRGYHPHERIKHFNLVSMERPGEKTPMYLEMETRQSRIRVALASSTVFDNPPAEVMRVNRIYGEKISEEYVFHAEKGETYHFTKWVTIYSSREGYEKQLQATTTDTLHDLLHEGVDYHLQKHLEFRERQWEAADIRIEGDGIAQKGIRFNIYHMLIAKPHHDPQACIGARFLTGEGYKGHCFWDSEIFLLPFYIYTFPKDARNLILYRYFTLEGSFENAKALGYRGAKIAWESADTGIEETPSYFVRTDGTLNKIFNAEEEHHIVSDVVYGVFNYVNATDDKEFLFNHGAEVIFQTARFWLSRVEWRRNRYEIRKVIGPDELHEHVDNNAYTNYIVSWHLKKAARLYRDMQVKAPDALNSLKKKMGLSESEVEEMQNTSDKMFLPVDEDTELIEQFEGYFSRKDCMIAELNADGLPICPGDVDRISIDRTQLIKQADVVLLLYLLPRLFTPAVTKENYLYYEKRTLHESSLSLCINGIMGLEVGENQRAYEYFIRNSHVDLNNVYKNTGDGIHAAATGGAWMMLFHGFAGIKTGQGSLRFNPRLPDRWRSLELSFMWRENVLKVRITHDDITLTVDGKEIDVEINGKKVTLKPDTVNHYEFAKS